MREGGCGIGWQAPSHPLPCAHSCAPHSLCTTRPTLQVVRYERTSRAADIWSLGILVWEIATGEDITDYVPLSISRLQVGGL